MSSIQQAVASLRPNVEWSMNGDDIDGIIWHSPNVNPVTKSEVNAEIIRLDDEAAAQATAAAAATAAAIAHAKSLGFTEEMIAIMYPNLGAQSE